MKKSYETPQIEVRNYTLPPNGVIMTSNGEVTTNLDGEDVTYFK